MSGHDEDVDGGQRLACGRSADQLLEQVATARPGPGDAHQQSCVHCRAALAEYRRLWAPMQHLAAERVTAPRGPLDRVLELLRERLRSSDYAVLPGARGSTRIAARVVLVTARRHAQSVPGVRVALSHELDPGSTDDVTVGVAGESTAIEVTVAADYGADLLVLGERVREAVASGIHRITGLHAASVTVTIDDVLPPRDV